MASQKQRGISAQPSVVSKFYEGKTLFITGAAGYLGVVLLEILLRCCPDIRRIYILLRPKKGVLPQERKESIFKKEIFFKIKEKNPDALNRVVVISGDVTHKDLGMSADDLHKLSQEVTLVFHCAAAISFTKPLSFMMQQNVVATYNVIEFCRRLQKLDVLAYTSTAYSNSNLQCEIEEKIYELPFTAEEALKALKNGNNEELMFLFSKCKPSFPNFYTFTKNLSEKLLTERASDLPICIVRPSIIVSCMQGVIPGYIEDGSGLVSLAVGVGKGFIRVVLCDPDKKTNQIPVDVVANTHIVAAYQQVAQSLPSPFIYNCVAGETTSWTWNQFIAALLQMVLKHPLPKSYQKPNILVCKNPVKYWIVSILDHYAPAVVIDFLLWLSGRKPRLVKLYRFYDKSMVVMRPFMLNEWIFKDENFLSLGHKMNATDADLFNVDLKKFDLEDMTEKIRTGAPLYKRNNNPHEKQLQSTYMHNYLTSIIKWSLLGFIASVFYIAVF